MGGLNYHRVKLVQKITWREIEVQDSRVAVIKGSIYSISRFNCLLLLALKAEV